jgi:hypothetical protein
MWVDHGQGFIKQDGVHILAHHTTAKADLLLGIRRQAARLQRIETRMIEVLQAPQVRARVRLWSLAEFIENPAEPLHTLFDEIAPNAQSRLIRLPDLVDLSGFGSFLQALRNDGMQPVLMGDFPLNPTPPDPPHRIK